MAENYLQCRVKAISENEGFLRSAVGAFCVGLNPSLEEVNDLKTAVSEAVTNCIVHGYNGTGEGDIVLSVRIEGEEVTVVVEDFGVGIPDIEQAIQPFYTTKGEDERSGMGFTVMQAFMDDVKVTANTPAGVRVELKKRING